MPPNPIWINGSWTTAATQKTAVEATLCVKPSARTAGRLLSVRSRERHALDIELSNRGRSFGEARLWAVATVRASEMSAPIVLEAMLDDTGPTIPWISLRIAAAGCAIFLDDDLADEDWQLGGVLSGGLQIERGPAVADAIAFDRALSPDELFGLVASRRVSADQRWQTKPGVRTRRAQADHPGSPARQSGPAREIERPMQYWKPSYHNANVGDCMPFCDGKALHLFYLLDRRRHRSKAGLGAHQWAHAVTSDLVSWRHLPLAIGIDEQWEGSICTGSVLLHGGVYYAFYAVRMADRTSPAFLTVATSADGIRFEKTHKRIELSGRYRLQSVRDPEVLLDSDGTVHLLVTTSLDEGASHRGCIAHLVSRDLDSWEEREPFLVPGYSDEPECCNVFSWRGTYYLIFSNHGVARYRTADSIDGPWHRPRVDQIDTPEYRVPKSAPLPTEDRRMLAGFHSDGPYAGRLVWRELVRRPDATLGTCFVREIVDSLTGPPLDIEVDALRVTGNLHAPVPVVAGSAGKGVRLRFAALPTNPTCAYGVCIESSEPDHHGYQVRFDAAAGSVSVRPAIDVSWEQYERTSIFGVEGLEREARVDAIIAPDFVDVSINGTRTLLAAVDAAADRIAFFSEAGAVSVRYLEAREFRWHGPTSSPGA